MLSLEAVTETLGGELACSVARKAQSQSDCRAEQRVSKGSQDQRYGALRDMMRFVAGGELGDEAADRIEDRVQRVTVARQDHPGGKGSSALLAERIEALVDDHARVGLAGAGAFDRFGDALVHRIRD